MSDFPNYDVKTFTQRVIDACHFKKLPQEELNKIQGSIENILLERLAAIIYNDLDDEELGRYQELLKDPALQNQFEALLEAAKAHPQLEELLTHATEELFMELTQNSSEIQSLMDVAS